MAKIWHEDRLDVSVEEGGVIIVIAVSAYGDPLDLGEDEVEDFIEKLQSALKESREGDGFAPRNIQIIDGADNATFSFFRATEDEFQAIFPDGRDMELVEDFFERVGDAEVTGLLKPIWERPVLKQDVMGIHGTLFYDNKSRRKHVPPSKREVDWNDGAINEGQRRLFRAYR